MISLTWPARTCWRKNGLYGTRTRAGGRVARELVDLDLLHLVHRRRHALRPLGVGIGEQLDEPGRDDLPRQAESVLQPAARALLPALGELAPVRVDLVLRLTEDLERDRL